MKNYVYENFEDVKESIASTTPPVVYKYRADWENPNHKSLVTNQILWFSAPRDLNDPYDIRTPIAIDYSEIEHPIFFAKLKAIYLAYHPNINFTERDLNTICENRLDNIRKDPKGYFGKNYNDIRENETFDRIGVCSCTINPLSEQMWASYADNYKGFAVGFRTVNICEDLLCSIGKVTYDDKVPTFSFINPRMDDDFDTYFLKSKKWSHEGEFRFFTIGDDSNIERAKKYSIDSVNDFVIGHNFPKDMQDDFLTEVRKIFSKEIPIYQTKPKVYGYGLDIEQLD